MKAKAKGSRKHFRFEPSKDSGQKVQGSDDYLEPFLNLQTKGSEGGCAGTVEGYIKNVAAV